MKRLSVFLLSFLLLATTVFSSVIPTAATEPQTQPEAGQGEPSTEPTEADLEGSCGENVTWKFIASEGKLVLSGSGAMTEIAGGLSSPWYEQREKIKAVEVADGIVLTKYAFYGCTALTSVKLPADLTEIPEGLFAGCTALSSVKIPDTVQKIGGSAFYDCGSLVRIDIPASVTEIGISAFSNCLSLKIVNFAEGSQLKTLKYGAFQSTNIISVTIPESVTTIEWDVFNCNTLVQVTNLSGQPLLGYSPQTNHDDPTPPTGWFVTDSELRTSLNTPFYNTLTYHEDGVITYTVGNEVWLMGYVGDETELDLTQYHITKVYSYAFYDTKLTSIALPASVTLIGAWAFSWTDTLCRVTFAEGSQLKKLDGWGVFEHATALTEIELPSGLTEIPTLTFSGCSYLLEITIPATVTTVGGNAFDGCGRLVRVTNLSGLSESTLGLPSNRAKEIRTSKNKAFQSVLSFDESGCIFYTGTIPYVGTYKFLMGYLGTESELDLSDFDFTAIYPNSFSDNAHVTSLCLPATLVRLDDGAFADAASLKNVEFAAGTTISYFGDSAFLNCTSLEEIVIPTGITQIGNSCFSGCTSLKSVTIPKSVTDCRYGAFEGCNALEAVYIKDLEAWCKTVFEYENCNPLTYAGNLYLNEELVTELVIPEKVTSIKKLVFSGGTCFTSVRFHSKITSVGADAFKGCTGLNRVDADDLLKWAMISFANVSANPLSYAGRLYHKSALVTNLDLTDVIGINNYAFYGCKSLIELTVPATVEVIGADAFAGCDRLIHITNFSTQELNGLPANIGQEVRTSTEIAFANPIELFVEDGMVTFTVGETVCLLDYQNEATALDLNETAITAIYPYAFCEMNQLQTIILEDGLSNIGTAAFYGCSELKSIVLPDTLECVNANAFAGCPDGVELLYHGTEELLAGVNADVTNAAIWATVQIVGHDRGVWTDTENGTHTSTCICGDFVEEPHGWDEGVEQKAPTHLEIGEKLHQCTLCTAEKVEPIEKLPDHTFEYSKKDQSVHTKYCACGESTEEAHEWNDGVVTTTPTHEAMGVKTFTCLHCEETRTEDVAKLTDHSYECKKHNADQHKRECVCGDFYLEEHEWNDGEVTTAPTTDAEGVKTYTCADCGETKTESIEKLPVTPDEGSGDGSSSGGSVSSDDETSGCSGTVSAGLGMMLLLGASLMLIKKKKD